MKRKHFLQRMFSGSLPVLLFACGLLVSCDKEDMTHTEGTPLPEGKYPLVLTASVGEMQTRSAGKDGWAENDPIGVRIGDAGAKVGKYLVSQDGSTRPADDGEALYWQNTAPATITAWYPYEAKNDVDISNQQAGYADFDYLTAIAENKSYKDKGIELQFKHRMAKVKYTLTQGEGVNEATLQNAAVAISGYTKATFSKGVLTSSESENGWITPTADGEVLLVPQDMSGKQFIKVSVDGTDFYYTPTSGMTLEAGLVYTYTITVKAKGIEVAAETSGQWDSKGEELVTSDIIYTAADLKPGDYFYLTTGDEWAVSDGGLRKIYADGTTEWESDKTQDNSKGTCIGIVLKVGRDTEGSWADNCDYKLKGSTTSMSEVHGYVLALRDAHDGCPWGSFGTEVGCDRNQTTGFNGYSNTQTIVAKVQGGNLQDAFPAAYYATIGYEAQYPAPANTSGWFLPSGGQCQYWLNHRDVILRNVQNAGGDGWKDWYWSSSEDSGSPARDACSLYMRDGFMVSGHKYYDLAVRACLAF